MRALFSGSGISEPKSLHFRAATAMTFVAIVPLFSFNVGIEIGQLSVLALMPAALALFRGTVLRTRGLVATEYQAEVRESESTPIHDCLHSVGDNGENSSARKRGKLGLSAKHCRNHPAPGRIEITAIRL